MQLIISDKKQQHTVCLPQNRYTLKAQPHVHWQPAYLCVPCLSVQVTCVVPAPTELVWPLFLTGVSGAPLCMGCWLQHSVREPASLLTLHAPQQGCWQWHLSPSLPLSDCWHHCHPWCDGCVAMETIPSSIMVILRNFLHSGVFL